MVNVLDIICPKIHDNKLSFFASKLTGVNNQLKYTHLHVNIRGIELIELME